MFDWKQLNRWNLSVDAVPPKSIINREYTLWERYRTGVIATFFAFAVLVLLIVSLLVNRAHRQRVERELAERLRIETFLAELSARFVNLPADQVENEVQDAQRRICEALDLDRSTLWQVPENQPDTLRLTHVYTPPGTAPIPERMDALEFTPWSSSRLLRGEAVIISTLATLPPEAARDRETFQRYGTKSTVVIPLSAGKGTVLGALSFAVTRAERVWPENVVNGFRMVSQVIANALARRRADLALQESQARLTLAAASADARLWEVDADTERIWMTEEGRAFFGLRPHEALTVDRLADFIHPDDRQSWRQNIRQSLKTGQAFRTEFRVLGVDGSVHWIVTQGRPHAGAGGRHSRMLGVSIDVTERRQVEERLRTSEELSTGILASLPGEIVIIDRTGRILRSSDAWREFAAEAGATDPTVLAIGIENPEARPRADQAPDSLARKVRDGVAAVLAGTQVDFRLEYPHTMPTGTRWTSITVQPLDRAEGGAVIYHQDITRQRVDRLETERLRRDLTHVGRVTTMGEMAAALAHELNQPLTAILSNAHAGERYLAQPTPPLDEVREILQDVVGDARRAGEVIQRLRSMLRKDETKFLALDVNQIVREMATLTHADAILRNLAVELDLASDLPPVRGDRVQLQQVLLNLVVNGMEAMAAQGEGRRIQVRTARGEEAVRVAVRDEGPGIPPDKFNEIFETFYTTKAKGMGMGLAISRTIVEAHDGQLWAENNPDGGATFSFTLPVCPPDSSPA
jgi:PAS domain S-box-containing protein